MIKSNLFAKLTGFWFFERWHPEVALRYLPAVTEINRFRRKIKVLEVGSGGLGIGPYLKREITGVDPQFQPPFSQYLKRVIGSAIHLPFGNNTYDVVVSLDMLEHLKNKERIKAIREMIRVAKGKLIIGVPCGKKAYDQDLLLDHLYRQIHRKNYPYLEEQLANGLPEKEDIRDTIVISAKQQHKHIRIDIKGNENLRLRGFLMHGFISNNILVHIIFRKIMLFFLPVLRYLNQEPVYRQIFIVDIKK